MVVWVNNNCTVQRGR